MNDKIQTFDGVDLGHPFRSDSISNPPKQSLRRLLRICAIILVRDVVWIVFWGLWLFGYDSNCGLLISIPDAYNSNITLSEYDVRECSLIQFILIACQGGIALLLTSLLGDRTLKMEKCRIFILFLFYLMSWTIGSAVFVFQFVGLMIWAADYGQIPPTECAGLFYISILQVSEVTILLLIILTVVLCKKYG